MACTNCNCDTTLPKIVDDSNDYESVMSAINAINEFLIFKFPKDLVDDFGGFPVSCSEWSLRRKLKANRNKLRAQAIYDLKTEGYTVISPEEKNDR